MKQIYLLVLSFLVLCCTASATDYYVSVDGNSTNSGTESSPFRSLQQAVNTAAAGDHIYVRGGVYNETTGISIPIGNNGTAAAMKYIFAYTNEVPVFNFAAQAEVSGNRGITVNGNYWHIKGLIVEQAGDNGIFIGGNNNTIEKCITRKNRDSGLQLGRYSSTATESEWPSNNLIVDCESYDNKDVANENADGFACKLTTGPGNIFRRCIAHHNIDDGWDLYTKTDTGPIGAVTLEDCIAHSNGTLTTGGSSGNGDKNGFKLGGEGISVNHIVRRCIAFNNGKHGFTYNSNPGSIEMTNCTGYKNAQRNFSFDAGTHVYKNNLSYLPASNDKVIGNTSAPNAFSNGVASGFTVNAADFISLTPGADNNPTASGFLNLASGSDLIDAGVITTGINYTGTAPDLGAIETGGTIVTPPPASTYSLTLVSNPVAGGTITKNPNQTSYNAGDVVTITATPAAGYSFSNWSGGASGVSATTTVTMNANTTVTGNFAVVSTGGGASATLRIDNTATTSTGLCSFDGVFRAVGSVNVINLSNSAAKGITWKMQAPAAGTYSLKWRYAGGGSTAATTAKLLINGVTVNSAVSFPGTGSTSFLITAPQTVNLGTGVNEIRIETTVASAFADIEYIEITGDNPQATNCANAIGGGTVVTNYTLTTGSNPSAGGTVSVSPAGGSYAAGTNAVLTATAAAGYQFAGWSGDASGTTNPLTVTMDANKNITATFTVVTPTQYTLTTTVAGQGSVSPSSGTYASGTIVSITATPVAGWQFSGWSGDATGAVNPLNVTMNAAKNLTATFTQIPPATYTLTTAVSGQGTVTAGGTYNANEIVNITATPAAGWQFAGWSGSATGTANPLSITMNANKSVTAVFSSTTVTAPDYSMTGFASTSGEGYTTTTGGLGGACITISTLAELEAWALSREDNTTPQIVYINGKISAPSTTVITVKRGANLSVFGIGTTAELFNVGLNFREYKNLIVRNLKIHEVFYPNDALTIDECQHVWVDHNEFSSKIGAGIGVDTYDGLLDIKNGSRYVTVSWNHFHDHMKNILIGHTDNSGAQATDEQIRVTFHHNLFENTDGRNPSLRFGAVHFYNNYLKNITDYGFALRQGAHGLIQNNVYENVRIPITTNKFDGEGFACESGNIFTGTSGANSITQIGCDWWTPATLTYNYTLDATANVTTVVPQNVGIGKIVYTGCTSTPPPAATYTLTATSNPAAGGSVTKSPDQASYAAGTVVTLTATPAVGYSFTNWSGAASGTTTTTTVTVNANTTVAANFSVTTTGGGGSTSSNTLRIDNTATTATGLCSFDGSLRLVNGVNVMNLTNTAGRGMNWKVEVPAAGTYSLKWRYAGGGSTAQETAKLIVNGVVVNAAVAFPRPANSTSFLTTTPLDVTLGNGVNEIRIEVIQSVAMGDIEWIEITGNNAKTSVCSAAVGSGGSVSANIACPAAKIVSTNAGTCSATVEGLAATLTPSNFTSTYTVSGATIGSGNGNASGLTFNKGITTVTYTVAQQTDKTCSFTVTVNDTEAPVIVCAPATTQCYSNTGVYSLPTLSANDNCGNVTVTYAITGATTRSGIGADASGALLPGTNTITWTVTDASGNTATCQTQVIVTSPVTITAPAVTAQCYNNTQQYTIAEPTINNNCGVATTTFNITGATTRSGNGTNASGSFAPGTSTITWTVTDAAGNSAATQAELIVSSPITITAAVVPAQCYNSAQQYTIPEPTINNSCGDVTTSFTVTGATTRSSNGTNASGSFAPGTSIITWTVTNGAGNTASAQTEVTVNAPVSITAPVVRAQCYNNTQQYTIAEPTISNNCGAATTTFNITGATTRSGNGTNASGLFAPGTSTITWNTTDAAGNIATATTQVVIYAQVTVSIPDASTMATGVAANTVYIGYAPASSLTLQALYAGGTGTLTPGWSTGASASSITVQPTAGTLYTVTVTDAAGCSSTASKLINVVDIRCGLRLEKVSICQVPQGNPGNANTICVSASSVAAHLNNGSYLGNCRVSETTTTSSAMRSAELNEETGLSVTVAANPSSSFFRLNITTNNSKDKIELIVWDASGKKVENLETKGSQTIQIGASYYTGMYYVQVSQGTKKQMIKLIKF
jgi:uncharacterized repeat protein (TIGR02543 family)